MLYVHHLIQFLKVLIKKDAIIMSCFREEETETQDIQQLARV